MSTQEWGQVDVYLQDTLVSEDEALRAVHPANQAAGLPSIDVAPNQGKLLSLLARMVGATRVLEIGTLGGYSTIWLARAVGVQGTVTTLEHSARHAQVARANIDRCGVGDRVDIRVGAALDTLPELARESGAPFDLVFIDADKENNAHYLRWAVDLARAGTVIVIDNVVRDGTIVDEDSGDPSVRGTRDALSLMAQEPRLDATALQTVGSKGWDGFAIALVTS